MRLWVGLSFLAPCLFAAEASFTPRELFQIPFGTDKSSLSTRLDGGQMKIPSNFTIDAAGHFYVYDNVRHRIARFSPSGVFEIGYTYDATVQQVFAYADANRNLWLLMSEPRRGVFYGVYDPRGKSLRSATFAQFNQFRFHVGDEGLLRAILSSKEFPNRTQMFWFDQNSLMMKKDSAALPPKDHHAVRQGDAVYYVNPIPGATKNATPVQRVTDLNQRRIADIQGTVMYTTLAGEVYTRVGEREIRVYDVQGGLKSRIVMPGLASSLNQLRFDEQGNIYQLDGIPDISGHYDSSMPGMRMIVWQR